MARRPNVLKPGPPAGSDRITIIWPDGAIKNQWLQTTIHASEYTGLTNDYTFYFGNAPGDTCDKPTNTYVNALDTGNVRNTPHNFLTALKLITVP